MANFDLERYATVADRVLEFWRDHPEGSIRTRLHSMDGPTVVFEARVYRTRQDVTDRVYTSGWAHEVEGKSPVNKTSHVENCESSAVGRALANLGYSTDSERPSRSEMLKVSRMRAEHEGMLEFIREVGIRLPDETEIQIGGAARNLKAYTRENWQSVKERFATARALVESIEASTGETFRSATT